MHLSAPLAPVRRRLRGRRPRRPARSDSPTVERLLVAARSDGDADLTGTDGEVRAWVPLPCTVAAAGTALLPVAPCGPCWPSCGASPVGLEISAARPRPVADDPGRLELRCGRDRFRLPWENPEAFRPGLDFEVPARYALAPRALRDAGRRTLYATDAESRR